MQNTTQTTPNSAAAPATRQGRYPVRLPIRMTQAERAVIGKSACALDRSISRYLVELALQSASQPQPQDRTRLTFLHALFHGATEKVQAALASERMTNGEGDESAAARVCLQEVLRLLEAISQEIGRRRT